MLVDRSKACSIKTIYLQQTGLIWAEVKQLWDLGAKDYMSDMWNVLDFTTNTLYLATITLRAVSYIKVSIKLSKVSEKIDDIKREIALA